MILKNIEYYIEKRDFAIKRIAAIDKMLAASKKTIQWRYSPERLKTEREALSEDLKGYHAIISHLESGIRLSRYHNYRQAFRILNREYTARRRAERSVSNG